MGVTGIGGSLSLARVPAALRDWYIVQLGVCSAPYGEWETEEGTCVFAAFAADTDSIAADRRWMLNLRMNDLDDLCAPLRAAGITVTTNPEWGMTGGRRFASTHDPEKNPIELRQPDPSA